MDIVEFAEATSSRSSGPFDILFVEGSISTPEQAEEHRPPARRDDDPGDDRRLRDAGGIQALRNWADHDAVRSLVYPDPEYVESLATATPSPTTWSWTPSCAAARSRPDQLREFVTALLVGRRPQLPDEAVCAECKRRGATASPSRTGSPASGR